MDRFRLISSIIVLFVYLLMMFPFQTIVTSLFILLGYIILRNSSNNRTIADSKTMRRREALRTAKLFLAPYNDIWSNLKLSNKFCSIHLTSGGRKIKAYDSLNNKRYFIVTESTIHSYDDLWDMICTRFVYNTSFEGLINMCERFGAKIDLHDETKIITTKSNTNLEQNTKRTLDIEYNNRDKVDINNASEIELTALPGISIVMSKKLIKKREEIGGFKSVDDVFLFLKLKPHLQSQLADLICVNKMKGSYKIKRYNERSIDL